jgi:hypothetical protein
MDITGRIVMDVLFWWLVIGGLVAFFHRDPKPGEPVLGLDPPEYHTKYWRATEEEKRAMRRAELDRLDMEFIND